MTRRSRAAAWLLVGAVLVVATAVLSAPPEQAMDTGPFGTSALRSFLRTMGFEVEEAEEPPEEGTFVLLSDLRTHEDTRPLLDWVEAGGRLVVTDPGSAAAAASSVRTVDAGGGFAAKRELRPACPSSLVVGVGSISVDPVEGAVAAGSDRAVGCFPSGDGAFVVSVPRGGGEIVVVAGASPLTNARLADADNAILAYRLMRPGGTVVFGPALPARSAGGGGLWQAMPDGARAVVLAVILAAVAFALVRGRRMGRSVPELPLTAVPASELTAATGRLYRRAGAVGYAGGLVRRAASQRIGRRLGLGAAAPDDVERVLRATARADASVLTGPEPRDDEDLIALGRQVELLRREVEGTPR